jgi:hypothetical protein
LLFIGRSHIFLMPRKPSQSKPESSNKAFFFQIHRAQGRVILAACDAGLLDRTLRFGEVDFEVSSEFYGEERADGAQILDMMERAHVANVVGKNIVDLLVENGHAHRDCVLMIEGVPHVQILRM